MAGAVSSSAMIHIEENEQEYSYRTYIKAPTIKPKTKPFDDLYDLGDELGRGTQGVTYHAVERLTGKYVYYVDPFKITPIPVIEDSPESSFLLHGFVLRKRERLHRNAFKENYYY